MPWIPEIAKNVTDDELVSMVQRRRLITMKKINYTDRSPPSGTTSTTNTATDETMQPTRMHSQASATESVPTDAVRPVLNLPLLSGVPSRPALGAIATATYAPNMPSDNTNLRSGQQQQRTSPPGARQRRSPQLTRRPSLNQEQQPPATLGRTKRKLVFDSSDEEADSLSDEAKRQKATRRQAENLAFARHQTDVLGAEMDSQTWNFDFRNGRPMTRDEHPNARYRWFPVDQQTPPTSGMYHYQ